LAVTGGYWWLLVVTGGYWRVKVARRRPRSDADQSITTWGRCGVHNARFLTTHVSGHPHFLQIVELLQQQPDLGQAAQPKLVRVEAKHVVLAADASQLLSSVTPAALRLSRREERLGGRRAPVELVDLVSSRTVNSVQQL